MRAVRNVFCIRLPSSAWKLPLLVDGTSLNMKKNLCLSNDASSLPVLSSCHESEDHQLCQEEWPATVAADAAATAVVVADEVCETEQTGPHFRVDDTVSALSGVPRAARSSVLLLPS